ncbi:hypothetical protein BTUL_0008g00550 [Botrytis tulipae]|uniref:Heterokaryon incompatibility domain-containing protein n=1 Tax=Botrytis tulipae TaxID=87230 RepID=A0A4Z1F786_9HELO|nr:hypothetical protein BTUL_0008g00550 [Botrytis tulipae]
MLCEVCKSIDFGDLCYQWSKSFSDMSTVVSPEIQHHESYESLLESARKGCELCIEVEKSTTEIWISTRFCEIITEVDEKRLAIHCGPGHCSGLVRQTRDESAKGIAEFWFEWTACKDADRREHFFRSAINIFCEKGAYTKDAHAGLLWRTRWLVNTPAAYIAPSWSWASRDISFSYDAYSVGYYPADGWKLDSSEFQANISSCEIITVDGTLNGRLLNAKLTLHTRCLDSNQWDSLQDMVIAKPNIFLPRSSEENQILLSLDVQPSEKTWCLFLPLQVRALQRKAKSILRWVSSLIFNLVAKWRASPAPLSQKPILRDPRFYFSRKEAIQKLSTIQRDSTYLTMVQISSFREPAYARYLPYIEADSHDGSTMCLLVQPGTEEGTFKRVGLAQISNLKYCDSLPWEMRTVVLI